MPDNSDHLPSIDYMIRRSLTILLSDLRHWKKGLHHTTFGVDKNLNDKNTEGPILAEMFLIFNLWRCARKLTQMLECFSIPQGWVKQTL